MVIALVCVAAAAGLLAFGGTGHGSRRDLRAQSQRAARPVAEDAGAGERRAGPATRRRSRSCRSRAPRYSELGALARQRRRQRSTARPKCSRQSQVGAQLRAKLSKACTRPRLTCARWCRSCSQSLGNVASAAGSPGIDGMTRPPRALRAGRTASAAGHGRARRRRRRRDRRAQPGGRQRLHGPGDRRPAARIPASALPKLTPGRVEPLQATTATVDAQLSEKVRTAIGSSSRIASSWARQAAAPRSRPPAIASARASIRAPACPRRALPEFSASRRAARAGLLLVGLVALLVLSLLQPP